MPRKKKRVAKKSRAIPKEESKKRATMRGICTGKIINNKKANIVTISTYEREAIQSMILTFITYFILLKKKVKTIRRIQYNQRMSKQNTSATNTKKLMTGITGGTASHVISCASSGTDAGNVDDFDKVHELLDRENLTNKLDSWNKIDKMMKVRKLNAFADKYGKEHSLSIQEIKALKQFFTNCLDTSRLNKSKDVIYDRDSQEIKDIPSLTMHAVQRNFTLRSVDAKRVSTLKALAPRRKEQQSVTAQSVTAQSVTAQSQSAATQSAATQSV